MKEHIMATINELVSSDLQACEPSTPIRRVAEMMRDHDIGDILLMEGDKAVGIVTDRDLVVRCMAEGSDPDTTEARTAATMDLVTIGGGDEPQRAAELMRQRDVRRIVVLDGDRPRGVISLGDLAIHLDPDSALADISAAPPPRT